MATRTALVKERVWPSCNYEPHDGQALIHNSRARHRVASCGRRFGKSKAGGMELIPEAMLAYLTRNDLLASGLQKRFWIVGPNYDDAEREFRVFYDACKLLQFPFERPGTYNDPRAGNMKVTLWDGRFVVECRSADHPESLDGEGLDGAILVEAAKMKPSVWNKFIRPALGDKRGWSLHTSTPEGKNHFHERWKDGQDPLKVDWDSWRMPSWDNLTIFPGGRQDPEILAMKDDMSDELFNQEIAALFTDFVGRVFKDFDEEVHVGDFKYDARYPVYLAVDYGWTNPFVALFVQVDAHGNVYVIEEYRALGKDVNEVGRELLQRHGPLVRQARTLYPDPAEPGDTNILANRLKVHVNPDTGGDLKYRLEYIRQFLKLGPEHVAPEKQLPKLFFDRGCTEMIREMGEYRYPDKKSEDKQAKEDPLDKDDHGPEALGRFFRGFLGDPTRVSRRARVSDAVLTA